MEYNVDLFIRNRPIETKFGEVRFLTYGEYLDYQHELSLISMNALHIHYFLRNLIKNQKLKELAFNFNFTDDEIEELKKYTLLECIHAISDRLPDFLYSYLRIFNLVIKFKKGFDIESIFLSEEDFTFIRKLIMDMNVLIEDEVNPNPEIQEALELSKNIKKQNAPKQTYTDIATTVAVNSSNDLDKIFNMNVYQVLYLYARINAKFEHNMTTIFATVSDKIKVEYWNKHIDLYQKEKHTIEYNQFKHKYGKIIEG